MLGYIKYINTIFWTMLFVLYGAFNAASQSYVKFIVKGKVWTTTIFDGVNATGNCSSGAGPTYFFSNDTLINGMTYNKLCYVTPGYHYLAPNYDGNDPCTGKPGTVPNLLAFIREDTLKYKVYKVVQINGIWKEQIFLDFTLAKGDSVPFNYSNTFSTPYPSQKGDTTYFLKVDSVVGANGHGNIVFKKLPKNPIVDSINNVNVWTEGIGGLSDPSGEYIPYIFEYDQTIESTIVSSKFILDNGNLVLGLSSSGLSNNYDECEKIDVYNAQGMFLTTLNNNKDFDTFCANPPTSGMMILRITKQNTISTKKVIF
jgi:hypothetical protein